MAQRRQGHRRVPGEPGCDACHQTAGDAGVPELKQCGECKITWYCTRECQVGHWAAHKLEQISEYRIRHGEAVAVGIALDCIYARDLGHLSAADCNRILRLLARLGFSLWTNDLLHEDEHGNLVALAVLEVFLDNPATALTTTL